MILFPFKKLLIETEMSERSIVFELKLNTEDLKVLFVTDKTFIGNIKDDNIQLRVSDDSFDSLKQKPTTILNIKINDKFNFRELVVIFRPSFLSIVILFFLLLIVLTIDYYLISNSLFKALLILNIIFSLAYFNFVKEFSLNIDKSMRKLNELF